MKESKLAKNYFDEWAADYDIAFEGGREEHWLQKLINRLFRRKTFALRDQHLKSLLKKLKLKNKKVLDIGCGTGQLSLAAAREGARVVGWDIAPEMTKICQKKAKRLGLKAQFVVKDATRVKLPKVDIIFCIALIEYYRDFEPLLEKMFQAARETLVLTDARKIWWRLILRKILGQIKNFPVYYHDPKKVIALAQKNGFKLEKEYSLHSFRTLVFERV